MNSPCPIPSGEIFSFALDALGERGILDGIPEDVCRSRADALSGLLPEEYLPEIYLDLPLTGGSFEGFAAVFNCYDRCRLTFSTNGEYWKRIGIPAFDSPSDRDTLLVVRGGGSGINYETLSRKLPETALPAASGSADQEIGGVPGLKKLADLPARFMKQSLSDGFLLVFTTGLSDANRNFGNKLHKKAVLAFLAECGCQPEFLNRLERAAFNCGIPFWNPTNGYKDWIVCLDVAAFRITVKNGKITDCRAVIRISDRPYFYSGMNVKPICAYQWHITDNCDQRCKHCYLFAEDAARKCVTTPWDMLIHTLDEITADAAKRNADPFPHISGGDPILHPDFWRFAEELHRRGLPWGIMGNPFHLNVDGRSLRNTHRGTLRALPRHQKHQKMQRLRARAVVPGVPGHGL